MVDSKSDSKSKSKSRPQWHHSDSLTKIPEHLHHKVALALFSPEGMESGHESLKMSTNYHLYLQGEWTKLLQAEDSAEFWQISEALEESDDPLASWRPSSSSSDFPPAKSVVRATLEENKILLPSATSSTPQDAADWDELFEIYYAYLIDMILEEKQNQDDTDTKSADGEGKAELKARFSSESAGTNDQGLGDHDKQKQGVKRSRGSSSVDDDEQDDAAVQLLEDANSPNIKKSKVST